MIYRKIIVVIKADGSTEPPAASGDE